jgi:hypothetical protein
MLSDFERGVADAMNPGLELRPEASGKVWELTGSEME